VAAPSTQVKLHPQQENVICAAYFVSKAEEKMKGDDGISCSRLK